MFLFSKESVAKEAYLRVYVLSPWTIFKKVENEDLDQASNRI